MQNVRQVFQSMAGHAPVAAGIRPCLQCVWGLSGYGVSPTPAPAVDPEELRSLVREAVQESMPAQSPAISNEDLQRIVQDAIENSAAEGLTAADITVLVESAVAASVTPEISRAEIEQAIAEALKEAITPGVTSEDVEQAIAAALAADRQPGKLIVYSGRSESFVDAIIQQFSEATGVEVEVKYANTPQLAATLLEEGANTPADVFFAQDPGGLGAVEDMLSTLPDRILSRAPEWARSAQGKWVGLSGRARTVVYNPDMLSEADLPDGVFDFIDPKWRGRIGWAPTNASFQTMVTAMRALWGEDKTRQWLEGIQANNPIVYPKNTPQVAAVAAGEIDVGLVNHYYLFRFLAEEGEDFSARNYHPRAGGPGSTVMVAGAGILEASDNQAVAERFLEFMLSKVGQQYFAGQTFEYPVVEGVKTPHVLVPLAEINQPNIPLKDLADLEGTQALLRETGVLP